MPTIMRDVIPKFDSDKSLSSIEKKQVRFSKISKVVLIPSRLEYYAAGSLDSLSISLISLISFRLSLFSFSISIEKLKTYFQLANLLLTNLTCLLIYNFSTDFPYLLSTDLNDKLWFTPKDFHDCLSSAQLEVEEYMSRGGLTGSLTRQQMKDAFLNPIGCQPPHSIEAMPIDIMERGGVLLDRYELIFRFDILSFIIVSFPMICHFITNHYHFTIHRHFRSIS